MKLSSGLLAISACFVLLAAAMKTVDIESLASHLGVLKDEKPEAHADLTEPNVSFAADELTSLLKKSSEAGGAATEADVDLVNTVRNLLAVDMSGALWKAKDDAQLALDNAITDFDSCLNTYKAEDPQRFPLGAEGGGAAFLQQKGQRAKELAPAFQELIEAYQQCKIWEANSTMNLTQCDYYCLEEVHDLGVQCAPTAHSCQPLRCEVHQSETYVTYVDRMISYLEGLLDEIVDETNCNNHSQTTLELCCDDIVDRTQECFKKCADSIEVVVPGSSVSIPSCCAPRVQTESAECRILDGRRASWTEYDECYHDENATYHALKAQYEHHLVAWKSQMRAIVRMLCLVETFNQPNMNDLITTCINTDFKQDPRVLNMTLTYGEPPAKVGSFTCELSEIPGTDEWNTLYYAGVPEGLGICPGTECPDVCDLSLPNDSPRIITPPSTSSTTTIARVAGTCYKPASLGTPVIFALGAQTPVVGVRLQPNVDTRNVKVYLAEFADIENEAYKTKFCGQIPDANYNMEADCTSQGAASYLVLEGELKGTQVAGLVEAVPSWCHMEVKSSLTEPFFNFETEPFSDHGIQFQGTTAAVQVD